MIRIPIHYLCVIHESSIESFVDKFYMVSVFNNDFVVPNFFFVLIDLRASQIYELDEDDLHGCTWTYQYHESCHNFSFIFFWVLYLLWQCFITYLAYCWMLIRWKSHRIRVWKSLSWVCTILNGKVPIDKLFGLWIELTRL